MEDFIEAFAAYYDAKQLFEQANTVEDYAAAKAYVEHTKNEAEKAMKKVIRTELILIEGGK